MARLLFLQFVIDTCKDFTFCFCWLFSVLFYFLILTHQLYAQQGSVCHVSWGENLFFICSLTASRLALGHYQGDSLNQPMLISAYFHILTQRSIFIISLETIKFSDELIWRDISEFTSVKTKIFSKQGHVDSVRSPTVTFQKIRLYLL